MILSSFADLMQNTRSVLFSGKRVDKTAEMSVSGASIQVAVMVKPTDDSFGDLGLVHCLSVRLLQEVAYARKWKRHDAEKP